MSSKLYYHYQSECLKNAFLFKVITKVLKTLGRRRLQSPRDGGISSQLVVQPLVVVQPLEVLNQATTDFLFKTLMSMCSGLYRTACHQSFQFISSQLVVPPRVVQPLHFPVTSLRLRKQLLSMCAVPWFIEPGLLRPAFWCECLVVALLPLFFPVIGFLMSMCSRACSSGCVAQDVFHLLFRLFI